MEKYYAIRRESDQWYYEELLSQWYEEPMPLGLYGLREAANKELERLSQRYGPNERFRVIPVQLITMEGE